MMEIVLEKAYFEKQDVVRLINALPRHMQETAVLVALGRFKVKDLPTKGLYCDKIYQLTDVNPFLGVSIVNIKDNKDACTIDINIWRKCCSEYQQYRQNKQKEYEEKAEKLCKDLHDDMFG